MTRGGGEGGNGNCNGGHKRGQCSRKPEIPGKPGKKSQLTAEDRDLWHKLAQSVEPLRQMKSRVREGDRSGLDVAVFRTELGTAAPGTAAQQNAQSPPQVQRQAPSGADAFRPGSLAPKTPPPLAPFDRKRSRRIASGRIEIEARLDLHGARQAEAYGRFRAFILDCVARGMSTVLVVTGKGNSKARNNSDDDGGDYGASYGYASYGFSGPERGVLKRSVPMWLEEPELRLLVASYTASDIKHGGGGALYIHLRRRREWREP